MQSQANSRQWCWPTRIGTQQVAESKPAVFIIAVTVQKKAKYNAEYYKKHQYSINRDKAVKRGNSRKQKLKGTIFQKWNIKWDPDTGKYYWIVLIIGKSIMCWYKFPGLHHVWDMMKLRLTYM